MFFQDADGEWPVVEWRVYYPHDVYCSLLDDVDDLPTDGVQAIAWFIEKDGNVRCHIESGIAADPSIYLIGNRKLFGTMLSDDEYAALQESIRHEVVAHVHELRAHQHG